MTGVPQTPQTAVMRETLTLPAAKEHRFDWFKAVSIADTFEFNHQAPHGNCALWNGHRFETPRMVIKHRSSRIEIRYRDYNTDNRPTHELYMELYYPIDPRTILSDWTDAVKAYPNETNTAWLPAHTDVGAHHDYELNLLSVIDGVFQPAFRQYQYDNFTESSDVVRARAQKRYALLSVFYGEVLVQARSIARSVHLGYRHQQPHPQVGYLDHDITEAVATDRDRWNDDKPVDLNEILSSVRYVEGVLTIPDPETRWVKVARLEAERKAREEAAAAEESTSEDESETES